NEKNTRASAPGRGPTLRAATNNSAQNRAGTVRMRLMIPLSTRSSVLLGVVILEAMDATGRATPHPTMVAMIEIRNVSRSGLARVADPNSHDGGHHQVPVSPIAQPKSGGRKLGTFTTLRKSRMRAKRLNPTSPAANRVMKMTTAPAPRKGRRAAAP